MLNFAKLHFFSKKINGLLFFTKKRGFFSFLRLIPVMDRSVFAGTSELHIEGQGGTQWLKSLLPANKSRGQGQKTGPAIPSL